MKKYKVTQEFMDSLEDWRDKWVNGEIPVNSLTANNRYDVVESWRFEHFSNDEIMKRLGALLNWINGEDVFEIGTPKYIVKRMRNPVLSDVDEYVSLNSIGSAFIVNNEKDATRFITFEKASEWSNKHFKVVEVDE